MDVKGTLTLPDWLPAWHIYHSITLTTCNWQTVCHPYKIYHPAEQGQINP